MPVDSAPAPEFSRPVLIEKLTAGGTRHHIEMNAEEGVALAKRFDILGVDALSADVTLKSGPKGSVRLDGDLVAQVRQACVVTLAEVPARIAEHFSRAYAPAGRDEEEGTGDITVDLEAEDPPDPLVGNSIDIGEATAEALALALDPYPRAPGAVFETQAEGASGAPNPFAALAVLKDRK